MLVTALSFEEVIYTKYHLLSNNIKQPLAFVEYVLQPLRTSLVDGVNMEDN